MGGAKKKAAPNRVRGKDSGKVEQDSPPVKEDSASSGISARLADLAATMGGNPEMDRRLGLSKSTFAKYVRGTHLPGGELLARVVEVTACNGHWLLTGQGQMFATIAPASDDTARDHVRAAWVATLNLLAAACIAQRELAPLIGTADAGDPSALGHLADRLRGSMQDLEELSRAATRNPHRQVAGTD